MYWLSVYALVIASVAAMMGFVYLGLATALWLAKGVSRVRGVVATIPAKISRDDRNRTLTDKPAAA